MAATPRNPPSGGFVPTASLPTPVAGLSVYSTTFDEFFVAQDGVWRTADGGAALVTYALDTTVRSAITLISGVATRLDVRAHDYCAGVVQAIAAGLALVRWSGDVRGFAGLDPEQVYCGSSTPGQLTVSPDAGYPLIRVGRPSAADVLRVHLDPPILV